MREIIKFNIILTHFLLNLAPLNVPGVLFAPKLIYETPLSPDTELFSLLTASSLLIPYKIHLKSTSFTFNIAMFFFNS